MPTPAVTTRLAVLALLGVTATWGSTFFLIRDLVRDVDPIDFLAVRFTVAAVLMVALFWRQVRALTARQWGFGVGLGAVYGVAQVMQTIGLAHTTASLSGFITGLYVVFTPVFAAVLLRDRVGGATWAAVALSLLGLATLSGTFTARAAFGTGEWLTLGGAVVYALHILGLGRVSTQRTSIGLAVAQMITLAVVTTVAGLPGGIQTPSGAGGWASLLYMAVVAGAGAMLGQTWAQAHLPATRAALIMTTEPVFAAGFAVLLGGEALTVTLLVGGGCILAAMYLVELAGKVPAQPHPSHREPAGCRALPGRDGILTGMATLVFFHAHPDDEASQTSGAMARAVGEGHRVVVVYATNGDHGTVPDDLAPGETLVQRRRREAEGSAAALGTHRVAWLGYSDSGMHGWEVNGHPDAFGNADVDEAAAALAAILTEEDADLVTGYDWHGGYGHPDHVQVHRVVHAAAALAGTPRVLEVTMNRDRMRLMMEQARAAGVEGWDMDPDAPMEDGNPLGTPEAELHWEVDVSDFIAAKRAALSAHASQTSDVGMMLAMPEDQFAVAFGTEFYVERGRPDGMRRAWFLDDGS